jgi:hypothetical protein
MAGWGLGVEHAVNVLVVGFGRQAFHNLEREAHAKGDCVGGEGRERAIVITATASETLAAGSEGKARDEDTVKGGRTDPLAVDGFLESAVCVRRRMKFLRGGGGAPEEVRAVDAGKDETL